MMGTLTRLYLDEPYRQEFDAEVVDHADGWYAFSTTAFYPGGGGQPHDRGHVLARDHRFEVIEVREDDTHRVWHRTAGPLSPGEHVHGVLDWPYRYALMRHHGLMHVVNTIARDRFGGVITGVQLGDQRSRIDFKLGEFSREQLPVFEACVNEVIERGLEVAASFVREDEFRRRPELIRTLEVSPPIIEGLVRIVEIAGFDIQACGATHVHSTREIGRASIVKFDNKGKQNKRFYWSLAAP